MKIRRQKHFVLHDNRTINFSSFKKIQKENNWINIEYSKKYTVNWTVAEDVRKMARASVDIINFRTWNSIIVCCKNNNKQLNWKRDRNRNRRRREGYANKINAKTLNAIIALFIYIHTYIHTNADTDTETLPFIHLPYSDADTDIDNDDDGSRFPSPIPGLKMTLFCIWTSKGLTSFWVAIGTRNCCTMGGFVL